jgi:spore maturation protein CgeB
MNRELLETVRREQPDITLFVPYQDEFIPEIIDEMNKDTVTVGYYFDDTWRINYSRFWSKHYSYVTTSDVNGIKRWQKLGCDNFIYSPFSVNTEVFRKIDISKRYDVSFVGGYHPYRAWSLQQLRRAGIKVYAWGFGWNTGRLERDAMVKVFNQSRINLNMSNNDSRDLRFLLSPTKSLKDTLRAWKGAFRLICNRPDAKVREMVKGRHFEINACGGFQLSYYVEGLEHYYTIDKEITLYGSTKDMIDKIRYYLKHENKRKAIALRGYERTLRDHTAEKRFADFFNVIDF